jgi:hypothetical protein
MLDVIQKNSPNLRMRKFLSIPFVLSLALVAFSAYVADQLFGVVAFTFGYLVFCLLAAAAFGGMWRVCFKKTGLAAALVVFGVLATNFFLPPPSERLLRSAMLKAPPGTDATAIVDIVKQQYEGSPYAMPMVWESRAGGIDQVHVSLLSQKAKSCTAVIFLVENGRVSKRIYSGD